MFLLRALCIALSLSTYDNSKCWLVTDDESEFDVSSNSCKRFGRVMSVLGQIHPDRIPNTSTRGVAYDRLQFLKNGEDKPILEFETEVGRGSNRHLVYIQGNLNGIEYPIVEPSQRIRKALVNPEAEVSKYWVYKNNNVQLQISDISSCLGYYTVFAGEPGDPNSRFSFNYGSEDNWKMFQENAPLVLTKRVKNKTEHEVLSYQSVSVCEDAKPTLLDTDYQTIRAVLGEAYTLSCAGSGAPFLASQWTDENGEIIDGHENHVRFDENAEQHIVSTLVISDFEAKDAGNYTCRIFNKNFQDSVEKFMNLQHIVVETAPDPTYYLTEDNTIHFKWSIKGMKSLDPELECVSESGSRVEFSPNTLIQPPDVEFTSVPLTGKETPAMLSCILFNGAKRLDHRIISIDSGKSTDKPISPTEQICAPCPASRDGTSEIVFYVFAALLAGIIIAVILTIIYFPQKLIECSRLCVRGSPNSLRNGCQRYDSLLPIYDKNGKESRNIEEEDKKGETNLSEPQSSVLPLSSNGNGCHKTESDHKYTVDDLNNHSKSSTEIVRSPTEEKHPFQSTSNQKESVAPHADSPKELKGNKASKRKKAKPSVSKEEVKKRLESDLSKKLKSGEVRYRGDGRVSPKLAFNSAPASYNLDEDQEENEEKWTTFKGKKPKEKCS